MTDRGVQPMDLARWVESHGFESLWLGEHTHTLFPSRAARDATPWGSMSCMTPYVSLAAAAAVTSTLRLGLAVALLPQHNPITLAKTIASLDRISGGRILLGIGAGSRKEEVEEFRIGVRRPLESGSGV
jgi:alkanesulfonate monooxygenase SsuD/methylene tetrahydromethanopterin reductase-like flavin-dependent oxidoreductase (luciferase family)